GGARVRVLSPSKEGLTRLFAVWESYLKEHHLEEVLAVRGMGPMTAGEALVPGFAESHALGS
ncbi:MAG: hypothetical protein U9R48_00070, partial [Chloroflexota bacterium]|nr:hypothetical protein [Chloroflexota bacterium]